MKVYLPTSLFFIALLLGCSDDSTGPSASSVIMPLAVGNEWVYDEFSLFASHGQERDTVTTQITDEYVGDDSIHYFQDSHYHILYNNAQGLWISEETIPTPTFKLAIKYPGFIGYVIARDTIIDRVNGIEEKVIGAMTLVSTTNRVTVKAGTFICYQYKMDYKNPFGALRTSIETNYAPNVGEVYTNVLIWNENEQRLDTGYTSRLLSYHLVK